MHPASNNLTPCAHPCNPFLFTDQECLWDHTARIICSGDLFFRQPVVLGLRPRRQLIDAIDRGGIPLNAAKVNAIARDLGLDVSTRAICWKLSAHPPGPGRAP